MAQLFQLANEPETYGDDAGRWIVVTDDLETELSGPMSEAEATRARDAINATAEAAQIEYTVTWTINVNASSPAEAAAKARHYQRPDTTALVFEVTDAAGDITSIDLMSEGEDQA